MLSIRSTSYWTAGMIVAAASSVFAQSVSIYGGPTPDTIVLGTQSSQVNTGAGTAAGLASGTTSNFVTYGFRLTTTGAQALTGFGAGERITAINALGTVVGQAALYNGSTFVGNRAARWDAGSTAATLLNGLPTASTSDASIAFGVNAAGLAVGQSAVSDSLGSLGTRAVYWTPGGTTATALGNLGTALESSATGPTTSGEANVISSTGFIAGVQNKYDTSGANQGPRAVRWAPTDYGTAIELGTVSGFTSLAAAPYAVTGTNNTGTVIGNYAATVGQRAVRWDATGTTATVLSPVSTANFAIFISPRSSYAVGYGISTAYSVNDAGTTVGSSLQVVNTDTASSLNGNVAVMWAAGNTTPTVLAGLGTGASPANTAYSINAAGLIAGQATAYDTAGTSLGNKAVVWYSPSQVLNLNTLLSPEDAAFWTLTSAVSISATNWVTGTGTFDPDGTGPLASYSRAFLLQAPATFPVPEPASLAALSLAAAGLLGRRRRA